MGLKVLLIGLEGFVTMIDRSEEPYFVQRERGRDRLVGYLPLDERDRDIALATYEKRRGVRGWVGIFMRIYWGMS